MLSTANAAPKTPALPKVISVSTATLVWGSHGNHGDRERKDTVNWEEMGSEALRSNHMGGCFK